MPTLEVYSLDVNSFEEEYVDYRKYIKEGLGYL